MSTTKTLDRTKLPKNFVILPIPLPLGKTRKIKTGRLCYHHCKDLLGGWDMLRVLYDTFFECGNCKQRIDEHMKHQLALEAAERDERISAAFSDASSARTKSAISNQQSAIQPRPDSSNLDRPAPMLGWLPTAIGSPGVVSMHMGDMLSLNEESSWGEIARQLIEAKAESRTELQGVVNNIFGNVWKEELANTKPDDIRANIAGKDYFFLDVQTDQGTKREVFDNEEAAESARAMLRANPELEVGIVLPSFCKPYKRGNIPFLPAAIGSLGHLILGGDVGGNYARWVVIAALPNMIDAAVIDWGEELDPESIAEIILTNTWSCLADNKKRRIGKGFVDSHWRTNDVLRACWHVMQLGKSHRMVPTAMIGGTAARGMRTWSYHEIQGYRSKFYKHKAFKQLGYNFREAMNDTFITCIQRKQRRIWFPAELAQQDRDLDHDQRQFIEELCNDKMVEDRHGRKMWADPPPGPNHYGAALKNAITGLRFLTRKHHLAREQQKDETQVSDE
jgi:hypothetical protein